jgi:hypothetical protein
MKAVLSQFELSMADNPWTERSSVEFLSFVHCAHVALNWNCAQGNEWELSSWRDCTLHDGDGDTGLNSR